MFLKFIQLTLVATLLSLNSKAFSLANDTIVKTFYPNHKLKSLTTYKKCNGNLLPNGLYMSFFRNGKIQDSCTFVNGYIVGSEKIYSKRGTLIGCNEYYFKNNERRLIAYVYYSHATCKYSRNNFIITPNGKLIKDGSHVGFYDNDSKMDSIQYLKGFATYRARFYYNGKLSTEYIYPEVPNNDDRILVKIYNKEGNLINTTYEIRGKNGY
jgi:hypothetical protein